MDPIRRQLRLLDEQFDEKASLHKQFFTNSPLLLPALGLIAGIIIQRLLNPPMVLSLIILALCAILAVFSAQRKHPSRLYVLAYIAGICFACLGAIRLSAFDRPAANDIRNFVGTERTLATIQGVVITQPHTTDDDWVFSRYSWTKPPSSFYLKPDQLKTKTGWTKVVGTVRVQVAGEISGIEPGDRVQMYCWLSEFSPAQNPGQFDVKKYMAQRGVYLAASVRSSSGIELLHNERKVSFTRIKNKLRTIASESLLDDLSPGDQANAILSALLLGQRANLDSGIYEAFRKTGLAHFICLSGLHIGILAGFIWWACKAATLPKRARALVCIIIIALYLLIVPPRAATLRAAVICWFFCLSVIVRRKPNALNTLSLTAIVLLLFRPTDIFNVGWQLSYTTILGIILLQSHIANWIYDRGIDRIGLFQSKQNEQTFFTRLIALKAIWVVELFSVGMAAWCGGAGIMLYHFGTITPSTSFWTVFVFPFVFVILAVGFLKMLLAILLPTAAVVLGVAVSAFAELFIWIVKLIAKIDISQIIIGKVPVLFIVLCYCFLLFLRFAHFRAAANKRHITIAVSIIIFIFLAWAKYSKTHRSDLELTCLSVGHGQAIVLSLPGSGNMLFDAGSLNISNCGRRIVQPFLSEKGISKIDAIFLSHDDIDHINGLPEIVSSHKVGAVYVSSAFMQNAQSRSTAGHLNSWLRRHADPLKLFGDNIKTPSPAKITAIWPDQQTCRDENITDNNKSQVFLIEFAGRKILICGDIERFAQERILEQFPDIAVDIVVMPHHGATTNLAEGFTEKLGAETVLISCSRRRYENAFRPTAPVKALYTPLAGAITVKINTDGKITTAGFNFAPPAAVNPHSGLSTKKRKNHIITVDKQPPDRIR